MNFFQIIVNRRTFFGTQEFQFRGIFEVFTLMVFLCGYLNWQPCGQAGADHHPLHRLPRPHLLLLRHLYGREGGERQV